MSEPQGKKTLRMRFVSWVNGEREPRDRTLFVMEKRRQRPEHSAEEHEKRERHRLRRFLNWYPFAAVLICTALVGALLAAVLSMPAFGDAGNPTNNEVAEHYLEHTEEETGASNAVTGMILSYRGFDTLGESCVLFLAVSCVMILLGRDANTADEHDLRNLRREDAVERRYPDIILRQSAKVLIPFIFLFAVYVLLNGESSPGGGFSGGTILGCGLILFAAAFGFDRLRGFFSRRVYDAVRTFGLLLYAVLYGYYIFMGANGLENHIPIRYGGLTMPIDLAVGLVVACTVYGFYSLFARGDVSC
jgi:multicomponent Na+:H+ antiporter subunit B